MNDVVSLLERKMAEAAENIRTTTLLDPPFCDLDLHRPFDPSVGITTCRDCGTLLIRKCPCCDYGSGR